jgi:hypothetical protein
MLDLSRQMSSVLSDIFEEFERCERRVFRAKSRTGCVDTTSVEC